MINEVELKDCVFQLNLLLNIRKRIRNEFPPIKELDLYEKATAVFDEKIDVYLDKLNLITNGGNIDEYD